MKNCATLLIVIGQLFIADCQVDSIFFVDEFASVRTLDLTWLDEDKIAIISSFSSSDGVCGFELSIWKNNQELRSITKDLSNIATNFNNKAKLLEHNGHILVLLLYTVEDKSILTLSEYDSSLTEKVLLEREFNSVGTSIDLQKSTKTGGIFISMTGSWLNGFHQVPVFLLDNDFEVITENEFELPIYKFAFPSKSDNGYASTIFGILVFDKTTLEMVHWHQFSEPYSSYAALDTNDGKNIIVTSNHIDLSTNVTDSVCSFFLMARRFLQNNV